MRRSCRPGKAALEPGWLGNGRQHRDAVHVLWRMNSPENDVCREARNGRVAGGYQPDNHPRCLAVVEGAVAVGVVLAVLFSDPDQPACGVDPVHDRDVPGRIGRAPRGHDQVAWNRPVRRTWLTVVVVRKWVALEIKQVSRNGLGVDLVRGIDPGKHARVGWIPVPTQRFVQALGELHALPPVRGNASHVRLATAGGRLTVVGRTNVDALAPEPLAAQPDGRRITSVGGGNRSQGASRENRSQKL